MWCGRYPYLRTFWDILTPKYVLSLYYLSHWYDVCGSFFCQSDNYFLADLCLVNMPFILFDETSSILNGGNCGMSLLLTSDIFYSYLS